MNLVDIIVMGTQKYKISPERFWLLNKSRKKFIATNRKVIVSERNRFVYFIVCGHA